MSKTTITPALIGIGDTAGAPAPSVVDRETWQEHLDELLAREKALTREANAIAAARRRLPMVEVDATTTVVGRDGPVSLRDVFDGRRQLVVYYHMWHEGQPAPGQCEGCSFFNGHVRELSYLHSRDVTYAAFCEGPYAESARYHDFMGWEMPWYSAKDSQDVLIAGRGGFGLICCYLRDGDRVFETYWTTGRAAERMSNTYAMLDMTVYGRQETCGGFSDWLATELRRARRAVPVQRPPDGAMDETGRRALRRLGRRRLIARRASVAWPASASEQHTRRTPFARSP